MKSSKGETIAESLAAVVLIVMSSLIFLTFVLAGTKLGKASAERELAAGTDMNEIRMFLAGKLPANGTDELLIEGGDDFYDSFSVDTYTTEDLSLCGFIKE